MTYNLTQVEKKHLLYIVILALMVRVIVCVLTPVIGTDCYNFVHAARCFHEGQYYEGLSHPIHPLYPALIAFFSFFTGEYEVAGKAVATLFGTLTVIPLYLLTRSLFGHRAAIFACVFLAVNPTHIRLSADIMTETTHIFFFISVIWLTRKAISEGRWYLYALTGIVVFLDYMTRAEGIVILLIIIPWLFFANLEKTRQAVFSRISCLVLLLAVFFLFAGPYMLMVKRQMGGWHVTKQGAAKIAVGYEQVKFPDISEQRFRRGTYEKRTPERAKLGRWQKEGKEYMIVLYIFNKFAKDFHQPLLLFLLVGLFCVVPPSSTTLQAKNPLGRVFCWLSSIRPRFESTDIRGELFLLSICCLYFILFFRLATTAYYISGRYILPIVVISFVWGGVGFLRISEYLPRVFPWMARGTLHRATILLLVFVLAVALPKGLKIKRTHEISKKLAGRWIKDKSKVRPTVMGMEKVAFYADAEYVPIALENYEVLFFRARKENADYLVFYKEKLLQENPELFSDIEASKDSQFIKEWVDQSGRKKKHLRLYRFIPKTTKAD